MEMLLRSHQKIINVNVNSTRKLKTDPLENYTQHPNRRFVPLTRVVVKKFTFQCIMCFVKFQDSSFKYQKVRNQNLTPFKPK